MFFADWEDRFEFRQTGGSRLEVVLMSEQVLDQARGAWNQEGWWNGSSSPGRDKKVVVHIRRNGKPWSRRQAEGLERWFGLR